MSRVRVKNEITIYEKDGEDTTGLDRPQLVVESHWNWRDRVVLVLPDGSRLAVVGRDLEIAIRNATNNR